MTLDTSATEISPIRSRVRYYFAASGGNVVLERALEDGTLVELSNSPILDGEEVEVLTETASQTLTVTATANPTELNWGIVKR
tara:strand:- start:28218 stop:28466 length:249 start_codon:yes stop_codon:yes gene_type:complete